MGGVATTGVPSLTVATGLGDNSICYSSDGINWTGIPKSTHDFGVNGYVYGNGVAWNGTRFVAVGYGDNSICYSSDGINWTGIPSSANEFGVGGYGYGVGSAPAYLLFPETSAPPLLSSGKHRLW